MLFILMGRCQGVSITGTICRSRPGDQDHRGAPLLALVQVLNIRKIINVEKIMKLRHIHGSYVAMITEIVEF